MSDAYEVETGGSLLKPEGGTHFLPSLWSGCASGLVVQRLLSQETSHTRILCVLAPLVSCFWGDSRGDFCHGSWCVETHGWSPISRPAGFQRERARWGQRLWSAFSLSGACHLESDVGGCLHLSSASGLFPEPASGWYFHGCPLARGRHELGFSLMITNY